MRQHQCPLEYIHRVGSASLMLDIASIGSLSRARALASMFGVIGISEHSSAKSNQPIPQSDGQSVPPLVPILGALDIHQNKVFVTTELFRTHNTVKSKALSIAIDHGASTHWWRFVTMELLRLLHYCRVQRLFVVTYHIAIRHFIDRERRMTSSQSLSPYHRSAIWISSST